MLDVFCCDKVLSLSGGLTTASKTLPGYWFPSSLPGRNYCHQVRPHTAQRQLTRICCLNLYPLCGSGTNLRNVATSGPVRGSRPGHRRVGSSATHTAGDLSQGKGHRRNTISPARLVVCLPWKETKWFLLPVPARQVKPKGFLKHPAAFGEPPNYPFLFVLQSRQGGTWQQC